MTTSLLSKSSTRTLLKALSYRAASLLTTATVGFFLTGSLTSALSFGLVDAVFKMALYTAHEKAWDKALSKDKAPCAASNCTAPTVVLAAA